MNLHFFFCSPKGPAEAQRFLCGGEKRLGGEGGDGLPQADEDEIHGGG